MTMVSAARDLMTKIKVNDELTVVAHDGTIIIQGDLGQVVMLDAVEVAELEAAFAVLREKGHLQ